MIKCEEIKVRFDDKVLYESLSFSVAEGEHLCVKGTSGSGKSTLLKVLQGDESLTSGSVEMMGEKLNEKSIENIRKQIVWIPQKFALPVRSAKELLALLQKKDGKEQAVQNMKTLGLEKGMFAQDFDELSEGQKQRVVIAVCFCLPAKILLMDEPTAALDEESIDKLIALLDVQEAITIVSVSHNEKWLNNADRILEL